MTHPYETAEKAKAPPSAASSTTTLAADGGFLASTSTLVAYKGFSASTSTLVADKGFSASTSTLVEQEKEKAPSSASVSTSKANPGLQGSAPLAPGTTIGGQELFDLLSRGGYFDLVVFPETPNASGDAVMRLSDLGPSESRWSGYRRYRIVSAVPRADAPQLPNPWASVWVQAAECDKDEDIGRRTGLDEVDS